MFPIAFHGKFNNEIFHGLRGVVKHGIKGCFFQVAFLSMVQEPGDFRIVHVMKKIADTGVLVGAESIDEVDGKMVSRI